MSLHAGISDKDITSTRGGGRGGRGDRGHGRGRYSSVLSDPGGVREGNWAPFPSLPYSPPEASIYSPNIDFLDSSSQSPINPPPRGASESCGRGPSAWPSDPGLLFASTGYHIFHRDDDDEHPFRKPFASSQAPVLHLSQDSSTTSIRPTAAPEAARFKQPLHVGQGDHIAQDFTHYANPRAESFISTEIPGQKGNFTVQPDSVPAPQVTRSKNNTTSYVPRARNNIKNSRGAAHNSNGNGKATDNNNHNGSVNDNSNRNGQRRQHQSHYPWAGPQPQTARGDSSETSSGVHRLERTNNVKHLRTRTSYGIGRANPPPPGVQPPPGMRYSPCNRPDSDFIRGTGNSSHYKPPSTASPGLPIQQSAISDDQILDQRRSSPRLDTNSDALHMQSRHRDTPPSNHLQPSQHTSRFNVHAPIFVSGASLPLDRGLQTPDISAPCRQSAQTPSPASPIRIDGVHFPADPGTSPRLHESASSPELRAASRWESW